jgi:hypothetical protein
MRSKVPGNSFSDLKSKRSRSKRPKVGSRRFDQNASMPNNSMQRTALRAAAEGQRWMAVECRRRYNVVEVEG